jgi:hypothetical protein
MNQTAFKQFVRLMTPSGLSSLVDAVVWLIIVIVAVAAQHFSGSLIQQAVFSVGKTSGQTYQQVTSHVAQNRIIGNLPLFVFWLGIGMVVYYFAVSIYNAVNATVELHEELGYVNAGRSHLIRTAFEELLIRLVSLGVWIVYLTVFFKHLIPYVLSTLHQQSLLTVSHLEHAILAVVLLAVGLHVHTVFLRLVLLKQRIFG